MRVLNWKPSPKDERDFKFALNFSLLSEEELPKVVDLRSLIPEIWDQGQLGSCAGHSTGMAVLYQSRKQNREINPSRLFLYYNARVIQGWQKEDSGCYIRDCFKTLNKEGVCKNDTWPYIEKEVVTKPSEKSYKEGLDTVSTKYYRIGQSILEMKNCLANGRPFVFGFEVFTSFMNGNWIDTMPTPKQNEKSLGGHATIAVGYDDDKKCFLIKNSWGSDWKMKGYFWMPYSYIVTNRCDDFWTLESLKEIPTPEPIPEPVPEPTPTGCLDPFKLFTSVSELKSLSKTLLFKVATLMGLKPLNTSKTTLLNLLQQELKLK